MSTREACTISVRCGMPASPAFCEVRDMFLKIFHTFKEYGEPVLDQRLLSGTVPQLRVRASFMNMRAALENQKLLLRQYRQEDNRVSAMKEVMTYVRTNYADRIYLKDLAAIMNMNEQYFCRFFKTLKNSEGTPV